MPAEPFLPDDVAEVASIHISVGMGEHGMGCSYNYEGLEPEAAMGYVMSVYDQLREEVLRRWAVAKGEEWEIEPIHLTCPHCDEDIDISPEDEE